MNKNYSRSIGEIVRAETDVLHTVANSNDFANVTVTNNLQLTIINSYFKGMVGEQIIAYSYYLTDFSKNNPTITPINKVEELKEVYRLIKGKKNRMLVWSYIKEFRGYAEDPRPYVI